MFAVEELILILPEIIMLTMASVLLMAQAFLPENRKGLIHMMTLLTLVLVTVLTLRPYMTGAAEFPEVILQGTFVRDAMGDVLKVAMLLVVFFVLIYSKTYFRAWQEKAEDFYILVLLAALGMMVMISSASMLTLYLGLETLALSSYAMVAMFRNIGLTVEAAVKYFVLGALASGMLLYGISMLYGATGTLDLQTLSAQVSQSQNDALVMFGLVFVLVGLAFKLGAVPFHMWVPDVYQGAPSGVVAFISSAPKLAGFAILYRLLVDGLEPLSGQWEMIIVVLSLLSLGLGNVVAIAQANIKRMLAYSTVSHIGFLLLGMLSGEAGYAASMFYAISYVFMSAGAFGLIMLLSRKGQEAENILDFKGLNKRSPWLALMMAFFMASMAGIPPFIGFFAKLFVIKSAVEAGYLWLAAAAVVFAVIGAFYYLRVIKTMYFDEPELDDEIIASYDSKLMLSFNGVLQLVMGIYTGPLIALCAWAIGT